MDIATVPGTGIAGRVTKQDILSFIERGGQAPTAPRSPLPVTGPVVHPAVDAWPGDRVEPMSKIRKITADHMILSRRVSAHVTSSSRWITRAWRSCAGSTSRPPPSAAPT